MKKKCSDEIIMQQKVHIFVSRGIEMFNARIQKQGKRGSQQDDKDDK